MHATLVRTAVPILLVLTLGALCFAGEPPRVPASSAPSIEGTYRLVSRQLPDGTVFKPPDVMGLYTYTKSHRNFNIVQKDATGKFSSPSNVSTYTLTATEYSETLLFSSSTTRSVGKTSSTTSHQTRSAPSRWKVGASSSRPFESRALVFEGNKITATAANNANCGHMGKGRVSGGERDLARGAPERVPPVGSPQVGSIPHGKGGVGHVCLGRCGAGDVC